MAWGADPSHDRPDCIHNVTKTIFIREQKPQTHSVITNKEHIEMSAPKITTKKVIDIVGILPLLHPQPNGTNPNKLKRDLINTLSTVPVYQPKDKEYGGMVDAIIIHTL